MSAVTALGGASLIAESPSRSAMASSPAQAGDPLAAARQAPRSQRRMGRTLLPRWLHEVATQSGEMAYLLGRVVWSAVRHPVGYWGEVRDQMYALLKLCWIPMVISCFAFGLGAPGTNGANILYLIGTTERLGSFFVVGSIREFAPWILAMVVAGVMGSAYTADLGSRRIREEIDAMRVLGVDPIRTLIVPRVVAVTLMTGIADVLALTVGVSAGMVAGMIYGASPAAYLANLFANSTTPDVWGSVAKTTIFGLIIGLVCCYKGMKAEGGPMGVGRAVNQAVVIAFAAIWVTNYLFTTTLLGLNPDIQVYR